MFCTAALIICLFIRLYFVQRPLVLVQHALLMLLAQVLADCSRSKKVQLHHVILFRLPRCAARPAAARTTDRPFQCLLQDPFVLLFRAAQEGNTAASRTHYIEAP